MAKIKKNAWFGGHEIRVGQKDFYFRYVKPSPEELRHKGKRLSLCYTLSKRVNVELSLNGRQINTIKKILKVAGEI
jgi:hypothetical protein